jgi:hypothetical protein
MSIGDPPVATPNAAKPSPEARPRANATPALHRKPIARGPQPCEFCGVLTSSRACYMPTDATGEHAFVPGLVIFAVCDDCGPQLALQTSAAVALIASFRARALALAGQVPE